MPLPLAGVSVVVGVLASGGAAPVPGVDAAGRDVSPTDGDGMGAGASGARPVDRVAEGAGGADEAGAGAGGSRTRVADAGSLAEPATAAGAGGAGTVVDDRVAVRRLRLGLGAGWAFPGELLVPGRASVRVRLPGGVALEPAVGVRFAYEREAIALGGIEDAIETRTLGVDLGTIVRVPLASRGPVDLELLVGARAFVEETAAEQAADGPELVTTRSGGGLDAGLGLAWWWTPRLTLTVDAANPLLVVESLAAGEPDGGTAKTLRVEAGVVVRPLVTAMFHLHF